MLSRSAQVDDLLGNSHDRERDEIMLAQHLMSFGHKIKRVFFHYTHDELMMTKPQWAKFARDSRVVCKHLALNKVPHNQMQVSYLQNKMLALFVGLFALRQMLTDQHTKNIRGVTFQSILRFV